jgi:hypothetical protein
MLLEKVTKGRGPGTISDYVSECNAGLIRNEILRPLATLDLNRIGS